MPPLNPPTVLLIVSVAQHQAAAMAAAFFRFLRQLKKIERREPAPRFLSSACHKLAAVQQLRQLGDIDRDPPRFIARLDQTDLRSQFPA
jgi:hypothetical protein